MLPWATEVHSWGRLRWDVYGLVLLRICWLQRSKIYYLQNPFLNVIVTGLKNPSAANWADHFEFCSLGFLKELNNIISKCHREKYKELKII